jgi:hypothetical protein
MKKAWNYAATMWRPVVGYILAGVLVVALLAFRLAGLVPKAAQAEIDTINSSTKLSRIFDNPVNAPYKLVQYIVHHFMPGHLWAARSVSVLVAFCALILFYILLMQWHTKRMAILGTLLLVTSSWFLHSARLATPNVMLLALLALVAVGQLLRFWSDHAKALLLTSLVIGLSVYVPGMIWFVVIGGAWQAVRFRHLYRSLHWPVIAAASAIFVALLLPLGLALSRQPELWREFVALPNQFDTVSVMLKNIGLVFGSYFVVSPRNPTYWLGRLPILDIFGSVMFILGLYAYWFRMRLDRTQLLMGVLLLGAVFAGINGHSEQSIILLPFFYIIVVAGITLMLQQWFTVFPRNPIARTIGTSLIAITVALACMYQLTNYFVAWPHNQDTRAVFVHTLKR